MFKTLEKINEDCGQDIRDGREILAIDERGDPPYITRWWHDVYSAQGGSGGPAGWFSGNYSDNWGDYPILDTPKYFMELPSTDEVE